MLGDLSLLEFWELNYSLIRHLLLFPSSFRGDTMRMKSPSRQYFWHQLKLTKTLTPLTIGVALLTTLGIAIETKPAFAQLQHYPSNTYRRTVSIPRQIPSVSNHSYPRSPSDRDCDNRVVDYGYPYSRSPDYDNHHHRVGIQDYPYSRSSSSYDHDNRLGRRQFPDPPRYDRRTSNGSRLIFHSPGITIRLGK